MDEMNRTVLKNIHEIQSIIILIDIFMDIIVIN